MNVELPSTPVEADNQQTKYNRRGRKGTSAMKKGGKEMPSVMAAGQVAALCTSDIEQRSE